MNDLIYIAPQFEKIAKKAGYNSKDISRQTNKLIDFSVQNLNQGIVEEAPNGSLIHYDVFTRLLKDRVLFLCHPIMGEVTNIAIAQMLFLEMTDAKKDIVLYTDSPGGSVYSGLSLVNVMEYITPNVSTVVVSMAASMGAVIAASGAKGKRYALKDARFMIHQPSSSFEGKSSELEISMKEMLKIKTRLYEILSTQSGQSYENIEAKSKEDYWLSADEAVREGFLDEVLIKRKS